MVDQPLDVEFVRSQFPALDDQWALMDNAGGSVTARSVIERVTDVMSRLQVQLGASYRHSQEASHLVEAGRAAMAQLLGADPDEVVIGASTTTNLTVLANAMRPALRAGDEVVVTNVDHEANIGPWRALEDHGVVVREWTFDADSTTLEPTRLQGLLSDRTRLVCFSHCSNVVGRIHDVPALVRTIHDAGALACVDGVAYAPHRRLDVRAWDVDFYCFSAYKVYGPHLGVLFGKRQLLRQARGQYHFFRPEDDVPHKLEPGNPNHELTSALPGVIDYLRVVADHADIPSDGPWLDQVFDRVAAQEEQLAQRVLEFLAERRGVRIIGPTSASRELRVPTISFIVEGRKASEIPPLLDARRIAVRFGHFYAYRLVRDLGLLERDGVVRISLVHYNTMAEVDRLIEALDDVL